MTRTTNDTDLAAVFAAPLGALEVAGISAARTFLDVIREFGFTGGDGDDWGALRNVTLTMRRANGDPTDFVVEIPILSLIPLPLVQLQGAELEFDVQLLGFAAGDPSPARPFDLEQGRETAATSTSPPVLRAAFAGSQDTSEPLMHVKLNVAPSDFPAGITSLLHLLKEATHGR